MISNGINDFKVNDRESFTQFLELLRADLKLIKFLATLFFLVVHNGLAHAQVYLNLDFEVVREGIPYSWAINNSDGIITADSTEKTNGKYSLRVVQNGKIPTASSSFYTALNLDTAIVGDIRLKGKLKTIPSDTGQATLFLITVHQGKVVEEKGEQNGRNLDPSGWREIDITIPSASATSRIVIGGFGRGHVTAWFDELELFINGKKHEVPSLRSAPLEPIEIDVLKNYCYPLKSYDPTFEEQDDLHILKKLWSDAKILGLGEESHGTSEVYKMKHRLVKYLAENNIFNRLSLEANMPESYQLNQLIQKDQIDSVNIKEQLHFLIYNTHEFKDIIKWIASCSNDRSAVEFSGFDMQNTVGSIKELNNEFTDNTKAQSTIKKLDAILNQIYSSHLQTNKLIVTTEQRDSCIILLQEIRAFITKDVEDYIQKDWLFQNTRIIEQYLTDSEFYRDKYMAENLDWLLEHNKSQKIIASGHNAHVSKVKGKMGYYLSQKHKNDYIAVGSTFHEGSYRAGIEYIAETSFPGTYECLLNSIDIPIFVLDLKRIKNERPPALEWLLQPALMRDIGAGKQTFEFFETNISESYDYLIFIKHVTPTKLLN